MRNFINYASVLAEAADDIKKKNIDSRDMADKLRDLINHPNTEPHLRDVAQRKLDQLMAEIEQARQAAEDAASAATEKTRGDSQLPAFGFQVTNKPFFGAEEVLTRDRWDEVYVQGNRKKVTFRTIIERALSLRPFRIDFEDRRRDVVGPHVRIWFYPEHEPEAEDLQKALNAGGTIWAGVSNRPTYYRGGVCSFFVSFSQYYREDDAEKKRRDAARRANMKKKLGK